MRYVRDTLISMAYPVSRIYLRSIAVRIHILRTGRLALNRNECVTGILCWVTDPPRIDMFVDPSTKIYIYIYIHILYIDLV